MRYHASGSRRGPPEILPADTLPQRQPATCKTATGIKETATDRGRALAGRGMRPAQDILSDLYQRKLEEINSFQEFMYCLSCPVVKARSAGASDADAGGEPLRLAKTRSLLWPLPCSPPVSCRRLCESIAKYAQGSLKMGSYPLGDLKGGLHRPPVAPLPIYEPHMKIIGGYPMPTTHLGMFLICKFCSLYICVKTSCLQASCQARPFSILHT